MEDTNDIDRIIEELCSKQKLERDRSLSKLITSISIYQKDYLEHLLSSFIVVIKKTEEPWESYHGILQAINSFLINNYVNVIDDQLNEMREACTVLLAHPEVRVRQSAGEVLGSLCTKDNCLTYIELKSKMLELIETNLDRQSNASDSENSYDGNETQSTTAAQIFHDTAGWRNLETSMKCLEYMIKGCGDKFIPFIDGELLELIFKSLQHTNRFVRETGFTVCAALVSCDMTEGDGPAEGNPMLVYGDQLAKQLSIGLADNWSQVRLAASVATRKFLMTLPIAARERFFPVLLPRICLNRYYVAEGVRLFSQETWRQVTDGEGRSLVEKNIDHVVPYYIEASEADNHAVREAACQCIAELGMKIPKSAVRPHVTSLLKALNVCFNDDSWPVRDAACVACGNFLKCFPTESYSELENLYPLFLNNLQDSIPSVRQGAAAAVANILTVFKSFLYRRTKDWMQESLQGVKNQPSESAKYSPFEGGGATYGVVKLRRDNDIDLHSNKQMYSCGSLAPKMGRGGCSDCRFKRDPQPWERADGCLYLIGELSSLPDWTNDVVDMIEDMMSALNYRHYTAHYALLETFCKTLPAIAKGLGKSLFKPYLYSFMEPLFYSIESENALCAAAGRQCLNFFSQFLGPNILRGRIEDYNPGFIKYLDSNYYNTP